MAAIARLLALACGALAWAAAYDCIAVDNDPVADSNFAWRGTNLGGWLVLEPWITPFLFYQFLGADETYGADAPNHVGMDTLTFCSALGDEEANRQLRNHWATWVTDDDLDSLQATGANFIRLPVGDWMFQPYEPYAGCTDGAVDELNRVLDGLADRNIGVLLDIHGVRFSQNGFDNSGQARDVTWDEDGAHFEHWGSQYAGWMGTFDATTGTYDVNMTNINATLDMIRTVVDTYKDHPAVVAIEPVNEPWGSSDLPTLQNYYYSVYEYVRANAPGWRVVFHDAFLPASTWSDFLPGCPAVVFDTHQYLAFWNYGGDEWVFISGACSNTVVDTFESNGQPVIVGEWASSTDSCVLWLEGWNDANGAPAYTCEYVECPALPDGQPGPFPDGPAAGPYGHGNGDGYVSTPEYGLCPKTHTFDSAGEFVRNATLAQLNVWERGHGWAMWNFKSFDPAWSFLDATANGWIPANVADTPTVAAESGVC